jgi:integrase
MMTVNPAAAALIEALKSPALTDPERIALVTALQAVMGAPAAPAAPPAAASPPPAPPRPAASDKLRGERVSLTRTAIAAMPLPATGERLVYDTERPQLAVRLRPSGRSWIVITWDRERQRKTTRTLGKCSALTPEQARREADRMVGRVADGVDIRRERDESITVRALLQGWHTEKAKGGTRTADELRDKVLHYLGKLADRPAREIEREDIGAIHHDIATKARKRVYKRTGDEVRAVEVGEPGLPATADKWRATLHAVYAWGQGKGLVAVNPCEGIGQAFDAKTAQRTNYLRGDSLLRFWQALEADPDADVRDAIRLMLYTGQRRGNVLGMRWADVDLSAGVWSLSARQTKQKKAQTTPLVAQACAILSARFADAGTPWVFPATRASTPGGELGFMSETRLRDAWARICAAAGITDLRPHDLRHTSGSWLARLGANEAIRQKALGHQTPAMAARYSHLEHGPVADALQRVANAVEAEATQPVARVRRFKKDAA